MPRKITPPDVGHLVERYLTGESVNDLYRDREFSRVVLDRIFRERGVPIRNQSDARRLAWRDPEKRARGCAAAKRVWDLRSPEQRRHQVASAHQAVRGRRASFEELRRRALARQGRHDPCSSLEPLFAEMLCDRGLRFDGIQTTINPYNADFTVGSIAVEVAARSRSELKTRSFEERCRYLLDRGWTIVMF